jgi:hypothetical protein
MFEQLDENASGRLPTPGGWNNSRYRLTVIVMSIVMLLLYFRWPLAQAIFPVLDTAVKTIVFVSFGVWLVRRLLGKGTPH